LKRYATLALGVCEGRVINFDFDFSFGLGRMAPKLKLSKERNVSVLLPRAIFTIELTITIVMTRYWHRKTISPLGTWRPKITQLSVESED